MGDSESENRAVSIRFDNLRLRQSAMAEALQARFGAEFGQTPIKIGVIDGDTPHNSVYAVFIPATFSQGELSRIGFQHPHFHRQHLNGSTPPGAPDSVLLIPENDLPMAIRHQALEIAQVRTDAEKKTPSR